MNEAWMSAMVQIILSSGMILGTLLLFRRVFRERVSPRVTATLWVLLIARLCVPVTIDVPFHFAQAQVAAEAAEAGHAQAGVAGTGAPSMRASSDWATWDRHETSMGAEGSPSRTKASAALSRAPVPWPSVVALALAGGALALGSWTIWNVFRQKKWCAAQRRPVSTDVLEEATKAGHACGLRRPPDVQVVAGISTPALTVSLKPVVLLPESLALSGDSQRLRFALMHEMTHVRRGDHLTAVLMCVLRVIWWFNPFMWIGFAFARKDMEAACDQMATRDLPGPQRAEYARMLVDIASGTSPNPVLGMGPQARTRSTEARIRNLYGPKRTPGSIRTMAVILACVLAVTCFTTACHPATEDAPPAGTADHPESSGSMLAVADTGTVPGDTSAQEPAKYETVGYWEEDTKLDDSVSLLADLEMMAPETSEVPITTLEAMDMTQERADSLIEALAGPGARFWDAQEPTRTEIAEEMRMIQEARDAALAEGLADSAQMAEADLETLRQKWKNVSPQGLAAEVDTTFTYRIDRHTAEPVTEEGKSVIRLTSEGADGRIASISVDRAAPDATNAARNGSLFVYAEGPYACRDWDEAQLPILQESRSEAADRGDENELAHIDSEISELQRRLGAYGCGNLDLEAALQQAQALITSFGADGLEMTMCSEGILDPYTNVMEPGITGYGTHPNPGTSEPVAVLRFVRGASGIAGTQATGSIGKGMEGMKQAPRLVPEYLTLALDSRGAPRALEWGDMAQVVGTSISAGPLLSTEEVRKQAQALIESWVLSQAADFADRGLVTATVEDALLTMAYEAEPNTGRFQLVPAWQVDVRVTADEQLDAPKDKGGRLSRDLNCGTLMLDAIDGSPIVDPAYIE